MNGLKYAEFYKEVLGNMGLKECDVPEYIRKATLDKLGYECVVTLSQVYEFLEGKHRPNAGMASAWEVAFGFQLAPHYYGFLDSTKPKKTKTTKQPVLG